MYGARLLPGEHRRPAKQSVEEATPRSVRSIRQRFEGAPPIPASAAPAPHRRRSARSKPRPQNKTQAELAAFLKAGAAPSAKLATAPASAPAPAPAPGGSVGSLIEKWSSPAARAARAPLAERQLQLQLHDRALVAADSVDTFGSSTADMDGIPKTDPGRLESYAALAVPMAAAVAAHPVTGDQSIREMVSKGIQPHIPAHPSHAAGPSAAAASTAAAVPAPPPSVPHSVPVSRPSVSSLRTASTTAAAKSPPTDSQSPQSDSTDPHAPVASQTDSTPSPNDQQFDQQQQHPDGDWGAGDVYIRELFAEAEDTAERAVHCDELEHYFEAFELYWVVVDLYYKVIPFLTPQEGEDVHERIKMYTRRCEAIREAFEDDPEGQDEIQVRIADATVASAQKEEQIQETFNAAHWNSHPQVENIDDPTLAFPRNQSESDNRSRVHRSDSHSRTTQNQVRHGQNPNLDDTNTYELQRNIYPDYSNEKPLVAIPEAPRASQGANISASTKAHRNSLSRPISRSAVRASTSSVSRERVAEMQERVNLMQECLNNFTVKRKHLGPARALELHVTTLNANTFGDLKKLEPLAPELEHKWATELEVLLSMLQEIKEVRPGVGYTLRDDIARHLPALERCDRSVRKTVRSFSALDDHVRYIDRESAGGSAKEGKSRRRWWVKVPVVEKGGLPPQICGIIEEAEKEMRGVFKVCHEINVEVVKSMPVPQSFVAALPKHARALIPRELKEGLTTWDMFKVSDYMKDRNLWHKEAAKEITSSLEKVALIWESKTMKQSSSFISRTLDIRRDRLTQAMNAFRRCQNAIRDLRREWPTMQHTDLDMAKIQHNEDIGFAGLEAYSRALESRAYRLLTRIRELLDANEEERQPGKRQKESSRNRQT